MTEPKSNADDAPKAKIRVDKWLWHARIVKTRTLAQKLVLGGNVRANGERIGQAAYKVGAGVTLTINVAEKIKILEIVDVGTRRGPAPEAQALYIDHSPKLPKVDRKFRPAPAALREKGSGRPTKKERRETDRFNQFPE